MKKWIYSLIGLQAIALNGILFAQETNEAPARDQGFYQTLIMLAIAVVFFYFILWRPEQKRRKELDQQRNAMQKGDKVTAMGIIGTVVKVQENTVILRMVDGAKIEVLKAAITDVQRGSPEDEKKSEQVESE